LTEIKQHSNKVERKKLLVKFPVVATIEIEIDTIVLEDETERKQIVNTAIFKAIKSPEHNKVHWLTEDDVVDRAIIHHTE